MILVRDDIKTKKELGRNIFGSGVENTTMQQRENVGL
jgi:hypothetical protein